MLKEALASADLSVWPTAAVIIFGVTMIAILAWTMRPGSNSFYERARRSILDD